MLILGLESATAQVGCAIGGHEGVLASSHSARGKRHAENLTPAIEFVCRQARVELSEISCVAVDNGPGLFTGLRVGVASGKAIAQATPNFRDAKLTPQVSKGLGAPMKGIELASIPAESLMAPRGW